MIRKKVVERVRKIICYECGKHYNYDVDDFCPRCGAFTQPERVHRIDAWGDVVRVEGINETNHKGSFVHAELHAENRKRKGTRLEVESALKQPAKKKIRPKNAADGRIQMAPPLESAGRTGKKEESSGSILGTIILVIIVALVKALMD